MKKIYEILGISKAMNKSEQEDSPEGSEVALLKGKFQIQKSEDEKRLAFGWASISIDESGEQLIDWQKDMIDPDELEKAAYNFVMLYREGGEMHERGGCATLVESVVFTPEKMQVMGIPEGTLPVGWWIGFYVSDDDVWEKVKEGEYSMFSIEGAAERVEVGNDVD